MKAADPPGSAHPEPGRHHAAVEPDWPNRDDGVARVDHSITAPADPRLHGGGGYVVGGLYNVVQSRFGQTSNYITDAKNFGDQYRRYNGMLINVSAAARCRRAVPGRHQYREDGPGQLRRARPTPGTDDGSYTVPKIDMLVSGTLRSDQGAALAADWNAPVALVSAALGRPAAVVGG